MDCCDLCDTWYHKACVNDPYCIRMVPGYAHTAAEIHLFNELLYMYCCMH